MPCEHDGHRKRLKARFIKSGLDDFEPHNVLELLLFYSVPRKDTNPLAHRLINRFGSLSGVFDAKPEELMKVDGVTENTAVLISMIPQAARKYLEDKGLNFFEAQVEMVPQNKITLSGDDLAKFQRLVDALEDLDDVQTVYHNVDLPDETEE